VNVSITHIDTACVLLNINGYRILTDPTLDNAGHLYYHGYGALSRKTGNPAIPSTELDNIDLVLLSHHQHKDNFDYSGRQFTSHIANVISTKNAAKAMSGIIGLDDWETHHIVTDKVQALRITATPAQHHPSWMPGFVAGKVIGFVIEWKGQQHGVLYISGDTVYFSGIEAIAKRYTIDTAIFHVGCVQFRYLSGLGKYTMDSKQLIRAVKTLQPNTIIPVHTKGWTHFKEPEFRLQQALMQDEATRYKTIFLQPGREEMLNDEF